MGFSDQAIGFFLQADDRLTPALAEAEKGYKKFVASLEKLNRQAFNSATGGLGAIGALVRGVEKLTSGATHKIDLALGRRSEKAFADSIEKAVIAAMLRVKLRLRASVPLRRMKMFDQSASLRSQYRDLTQPPDFLGQFQQFAQGGVVRGGVPGRDSVPAMLTPGELVLPNADPLLALAKMMKLMERTERQRNVLSAGLGTRKDHREYAKNLKALDAALRTLVKGSKQLSLEGRANLVPALKDIAGRLDKVRAATGKASDGLSALRGIGSDTRWATLMDAVSRVQGGVLSLAGVSREAFSVAGGSNVKDFIDNLADLRVKLGLTSAEYASFAAMLGTSARVANTSLTEATAAADALFEAGVRGQGNIARQAILVAQGAKLTRADLGDLARTSYILTDRLRFQGEAISALFLDARTLGKEMAVSSPALVKNIDTIVASTRTLLQDVSPQAAAGVLKTFQEISAASSNIWADQGDQLNMIFAQALSGSDQALQQLQFLTQGAISTPADLLRRMQTGDVRGLFKDLGAFVGNLDQRALSALAESLSIDPTLLKTISKNTDSFETSLSKAMSLTTPVDQFSGSVAKGATAIDEMSNATQKLQRGFQQLIGESPWLTDFITFLDAVPVSAAIATLWIAKTAVTAGVQLVKGLAAAIPLLGRFGGALGGLLPMFGGGGGAKGGKAPMVPGAGGLAGTLRGAVGAAVPMAVFAGMLLAIGFAAKMAAPAFEALQPVLLAMVNGFTELAKIALGMGAADLAGFGGALLSVAGGVTAMGVAFAAAAAGAAVFGAAVAIGAFADEDSMVDAMLAILGDFKRLEGRTSELMTLAETLRGFAGFLVSFAGVGALMASIGTVATIGDLVTRFLGFFGVKSPLQALSEQSVAVSDTLVVLHNSFARLSGLAKDQVAVQAGMGSAAMLLRGVGPLIDSTVELGTKASSLEGGLLSAGPLQVLSEQVDPLVNALNRITGAFSRLTPSAKALEGVEYSRVFLAKLTSAAGSLTLLGAADLDKVASFLTQVATSNTTLAQPARAAVSPAEIETVLQAVVESAESGPVVSELRKQNAMMEQMLDLMQRQLQAATATGARQPSQTQASPRGSDALVQSAVDFGY